ncbi:MAG: inositol monophosphatase [Gammaproteobacteria bacterium]|jgi:myo-inositol-1(or 4)-monophosphatase
MMGSRELDHTGLECLREIVISAAREELLPRFARVRRGRKADGSVVTEADLLVQQRIAGELRTRWPEVLFLGEEMPPAEQDALLKTDKPLWCLDPLDGTGNFAAGIPFFSVSLALLGQGRIMAGIVYDPVRDECFSALQGQGARLNDTVLSTVHAGLTLQQATGLIDFKRLPLELAIRLVSEVPYASQRSFGSVALDWCWIAAGRCHVYLHGRQNIWDYAAGHLILQEAGGHAATLSGDTVFVNALQPRSAVAALDADLFAEWTCWLGGG